jgi:hypothetical protein
MGRAKPTHRSPPAVKKGWLPGNLTANRNKYTIAATDRVHNDTNHHVLPRCESAPTPH